MNRRFVPLGSLCLCAGLATLAGACDDAEPADDDAAQLHADHEEEASPELRAEAPTPARKADKLRKAHREHQTMPDARGTYDEVVELIEANYVDGPLEQDALWTAATEGVLQRLIQVEGAEVNTLMSPRDLEELRVGTQGQLVGVGVMIELVADVVVVRAVIPGGPAAAAGLAGGDRILGIDGERIKGLPLGDIVHRIRGEEDSKVSLFVQRDTEEWDAELTRSRIEYSSVEAKTLDPGVGYLRLTNFATSTPADVDAALRGLSDEGMKSLVLDLRDCPGGLLDASVAVADLFLAKGLRVMSVHGRKHGDEDVEAQNTDAWESVPMVALVGPHTASGGEILAAALQHHERARVIGDATMGKGTIESVHELGNGWGLKLSVSRFDSAAGEPMLGRGVTPDIAMPMQEQLRTPLDELDVASDPQLGAAATLLRE